MNELDNTFVFMFKFTISHTLLRANWCIVALCVRESSDQNHRDSEKGMSVRTYIACSFVVCAFSREVRLMINLELFSPCVETSSHGCTRWECVCVSVCMPIAVNLHSQQSQCLKAGL